MLHRTLSGATLTAALLAFAAAALALLAPPSDSDLFWHLASGDWMLGHARVLDHDVFSFTRAGAVYSTGQWLGEIVLALAFQAGGWLGITLLRTTLIAIATFFMARAVLRAQPHVGWAAFPALALILETRAIWGDRPQLFSLALFPLVLDLLLTTREDRRARRLWLVPPLVAIWANLHGAFAAGLALIAIFAVEAWLVGDRRLARALAFAAGGSLAASVLNPAGLGALAAGVSYASTSGAQVIEEGPLDVLTGRGAIFAAFLLAALLTAIILGREGVAERIGPSAFLWAGLITPFALLGLAIQRQAPFACMTMAPFVAAAVPAALGRMRVMAPRVPLAFAAPVLAAAGVALLFEILLAAPRAPDLSAFPEGALDSLARTRGNLLNEYDWGGYLIRAAPAHPVFVDGRGATLYVQLLGDFDEAVRLGPGYREVLAKWDIALTLLRPDRPLAVVLREQGWRVLGESPPRWVLLARP